MRRRRQARAQALRGAAQPGVRAAPPARARRAEEHHVRPLGALQQVSGFYVSCRGISLMALPQSTAFVCMAVQACRDITSSCDVNAQATTTSHLRGEDVECVADAGALLHQQAAEGLPPGILALLRAPRAWPCWCMARCVHASQEGR